MESGLAVVAAGMIGAVLLFLLAWRRPTLALTVWIISSVVLSEYILLPDAPTLHVHVSRVLLTALLLGLAAGWVPRRQPSAASRPELIIFALIAWTIFSAWLSGTIFREDATRNVSVLLTGFLLPAGIFWIARSMPLSLAASRTVCVLLSVLLGYLIFTAFCEHFHIEALVFPRYILDPSIGIHAERARGPVVNAAEDGGILAMLLFVALHVVLYAMNGAVRWAMCAVLLLSGSLALWFTETRGPWLAFAGGLAVMLGHRRCRGLVLTVGAIGIFAVVVIVVNSSMSVGRLAKTDLIPQRSDNTSDTTDFRLDLYQESVDPFLQHPVAGWGLGTFTDIDHLFDAYGHALTLSTAVVHDTVVAITLESGIIGGILYVSFLVTVIAMLLRRRRITSNAERGDFYTMCLAALAAFMINGVFVDIRYFMPQNALVFFLAGLGLSLGSADLAGMEARGIEYLSAPQTPDMVVGIAQ